MPVARHPVVDDQRDRSLLLRRLRMPILLLGLVSVISAFGLIREIRFMMRPTRSEAVNRAFVPGMLFYQNGEKIENHDADSGIWISGRDYALMQRGEADWIPHLLLLIAASVSLARLAIISRPMEFQREREQAGE